MALSEHIMPTRDTEFKDESPLNTVARIKNILQQHGITTIERWMETSVPYCHAIHITVEGTTFGVNGKGLSKEFALASGYGELMERLQLGFVGSLEVQKGGHFDHHAQDAIVPAAQLLEQNRRWYEGFIRRFSLYLGAETTPENMLQPYTDAEGNVPVTAYHNLITNSTEYLPAVMQTRIYGTTGCAAGNSPEEAIVQALSEIVERHNQLRLFEENIVLPDIPEEVLQKHAAAYKIISYVRENGLRVIVKDCSLGEKFPVVCTCFINEKTSHYHTHFGAHPVFSVALERSLTESFQGNTISSLTKIRELIYRKEGGKTPYNVIHEMCSGVGEKSVDFFVGKPTYPYNAEAGFTGGNNQQLLRQCVAFFAEQGYDFLVRDGSSLGFPTCQVIIPGYSETYIYRLSPDKDDHRYSALASAAFRDPTGADLAQLMGSLMHLQRTATLPKEMFNVHGFLATAKLASFPIEEGTSFLYYATLACIYYRLGKRNEAIQCLNAMLPHSTEKDQSYLLCLQRYLTLQTSGYSAETTRKLLEVFHNADVIDALERCIAMKENPFEPFVLHCKMQCDESCKLYQRCCQKRIVSLCDLVNTKLRQLDQQPFAKHLHQCLQ